MEEHAGDWLGLRSSDGALDVGQEACLLELSLRPRIQIPEFRPLSATL